MNELNSLQSTHKQEGIIFKRQVLTKMFNSLLQKFQLGLFDLKKKI